MKKKKKFLLDTLYILGAQLEDWKDGAPHLGPNSGERAKKRGQRLSKISECFEYMYNICKPGICMKPSDKELFKKKYCY